MSNPTRRVSLMSLCSYVENNYRMSTATMRLRGNRLYG